MAKGFGTPKDKQLGYVLLLMPSARAYAAKFSLGGGNSQEPFIGVTNMLDSAQIWRRQAQAEKSIGIYSDLIFEAIDEEGVAEISIQRLTLDKNKKMKTETVQALAFTRSDIE